MDHYLKIDSSRVVDVDLDKIPTGEFIDVRDSFDSDSESENSDSESDADSGYESSKGNPFDFRKERRIGERWDATRDLGGLGCQGYDSCWIYDQLEELPRVGTSLWSDLSGIRLEYVFLIFRALKRFVDRVDISTNQPAVQVYTAYWLDTPRKMVHGGPNLKYSKYSAVAIEQQGYIDAINTPEWNVDQICKSL